MNKRRNISWIATYIRTRDCFYIMSLAGGTRVEGGALAWPRGWRGELREDLGIWIEAIFQPGYWFGSRPSFNMAISIEAFFQHGYPDRGLRGFLSTD